VAAGTVVALTLVVVALTTLAVVATTLVAVADRPRCGDVGRVLSREGPLETGRVASTGDSLPAETGAIVTRCIDAVTAVEPVAVGEDAVIG
jgi:hypothetical protein